MQVGRRCKSRRLWPRGPPCTVLYCPMPLRTCRYTSSSAGITSGRAHSAGTSPVSWLPCSDSTRAAGIDSLVPQDRGSGPLRRLFCARLRMGSRPGAQAGGWLACRNGGGGGAG
jgi:hypothetical protein